MSKTPKTTKVTTYSSSPTTTPVTIKKVHVISPEMRKMVHDAEAQYLKRNIELEEENKDLRQQLRRRQTNSLARRIGAHEIEQLAQEETDNDTILDLQERIKELEATLKKQKQSFENEAIQKQKEAGKIIEEKDKLAELVKQLKQKSTIDKSEITITKDALKTARENLAEKEKAIALLTKKINAAEEKARLEEEEKIETARNETLSVTPNYSEFDFYSDGDSSLGLELSELEEEKLEQERLERERDEAIEQAKKAKRTLSDLQKQFDASKEELKKELEAERKEEEMKFKERLTALKKKLEQQKQESNDTTTNLLDETESCMSNLQNKLSAITLNMSEEKEKREKTEKTLTQTKSVIANLLDSFTDMTAKSDLSHTKLKTVRLEAKQRDKQNRISGKIAFTIGATGLSLTAATVCAIAAISANTFSEGISTLLSNPSSSLPIAFITGICLTLMIIGAIQAWKQPKISACKGNLSRQMRRKNQENKELAMKETTLGDTLLHKEI